MSPKKQTWEQQQREICDRLNKQKRELMELAGGRNGSKMR